MLDWHRILGATVTAMRVTGITALLAAGLQLAGCGQKGPLFMPGPATQPAVALPGGPMPAAGPREPEPQR